MTTPRFDPPRRMVVKIGSSSLRATDGSLARDLVAELVAQLAGLCDERVQVIVVSSGAVAAGLAPLGFPAPPTDLPSLQAVASVGQGRLVHTYQERFAERGIACGQVLLTAADVVSRTRYLNARNTFERLLALGAVPLVNENDTVAVDELRFGDNDRLAALVASMLGAGLLLLLSDVDGLYDGEPGGDPPPPLIERVDDLSALDVRHVGRAGSMVGSGGMVTKLEAARIATFSAAHAVIANAKAPGVLRRVVAGEALGTWFPPAPRRPDSRKLWIAFARQPRGSLVVDAGAVRALVSRGSSLLAAGVLEASGDFARGDAVDVVSPDQRVVARGLVAYDRAELVGLLGRSTAELVTELGPDYHGEVIHRDSLVVIA